MTDLPAGRAAFRCPCGYMGTIAQVNGHCTGSRNPICDRNKITLYVPPRRASKHVSEEEQEEEDIEQQEEGERGGKKATAAAKSRWDTEDSDEPEDEEELDDATTSPVTSSSGVGSSESSSPKKPSLIPLDVSPTGSLHRIKLTVENLALYDTDRGEGYVGSVEDWVNEVIAFHFLSCLCIELRAVQLIPIESGGS